MTSRPAVQFKINFGLPTNLSHTRRPFSLTKLSLNYAKLFSLLLLCRFGMQPASLEVSGVPAEQV